jgi:putative ABC transport system ATP-binding protein
MKNSIQMQTVVQTKNATKIYQSNSHQNAGILDISMSARKGELLLLLGPSGSGKTTLLTLIAGLIQPSCGYISLFSKDITSYTSRTLQKIRATKIGFVFQTFLLIDALTVVENIKMVLHFAGNHGNDKNLKALHLLKKFSIDHLALHFPPKLSQGERQRVALARAIANDAELILADEPTASLEAKQGFEIIKLLHHHAKEKEKCVIVASHDLRLKEYADRVLYLENGKLIQHK